MIDFARNSYGGKVVVTVDAQAGSSGKGSLNAWLADKYDFDLATNNWMPNAGHYTEFDDGRRILVQHIPSAYINPKILLYINAGASIDIDILFKEIKMLEEQRFDIKDRLFIHPHANVITQNDKDIERLSIKSGSTFKGCGASLAGKSLRNEISVQDGHISFEQRKLAKDYEQLAPFIRDLTIKINEMIMEGNSIFVEGSQGIDLDINHAEFPFTTSRSTIPDQLMADAGIPASTVTNIIANIRTYPIRINNESAANPGEKCYSGNYWGADEITWREVAEKAGYGYSEFLSKYEKSMFTSVTKKVRRVFRFPVSRFAYVNTLIGGNFDDSNVIYSLNFLNFVDKNVDCVTTIGELFTDKICDWLKSNMLPVIGNIDRIKFYRTGPKHSQIIEMPIKYQLK
jgi:hypothetical protein